MEGREGGEKGGKEEGRGLEGQSRGSMATGWTAGGGQYPMWVFRGSGCSTQDPPPHGLPAVKQDGGWREKGSAFLFPPPPSLPLTFASSVQMATIRSVSFTRQLATACAGREKREGRGVRRRAGWVERLGREGRAAQIP